MGQILPWIKNNAESSVALVLAVTMSLLGLVDVVSAELVSKAIPLTLGVVAFAMLRERWRQESVNADMHESLKDVARTLELLHERVERIAGMDRVLASTQQTLDGMAAVKMAAGAQVTEALTKARIGTDRWIFKGGTGTHTRVVTLPACLREASLGRRELVVRMEILDPTNLGLCDRYARLYRGLAEGEDDDALTWTGKGTQIESYATILACCWYKQQLEHLLNVEIGLSSTLSTFRWDLSSRYLIVTQRGPRFPAMIVERGRPYYDSWNIELRMSLGECRKVQMDRALDVRLDEVPSPADVRELFRRVDVALPDDYDDADIESIVEKALRDTNPFVRGAGDNLTREVIH